MMGCGHEHDSMEQEIACSVCRRIVEHFDMSAAVAVFNEKTGEMAGTAAGNVASFALMVRHLCDLATREPRPTDCEKCGAAWDRMKMAHAALEPLQAGRCH